MEGRSFTLLRGRIYFRVSTSLTLEYSLTLAPTLTLADPGRRWFGGHRVDANSRAATATGQGANLRC